MPAKRPTAVGSVVCSDLCVIAKGAEQKLDDLMTMSRVRLFVVLVT